MEYYLEEFNSVSKAPMSLVMFRFAIEHMSRICRVLKQNKGHLLLVGIGGSGRQSASKLSTFINSYELYQIEITKSYSGSEWREDLKKVMLQVGVATKSTVFLFTDSQIKDESFIEDINMLLNTGDVPNIFPADEKADLVEKMQTAARTEEGGKMEITPLSMYNFFIERVKKNLHIVLGKKQAQCSLCLGVFQGLLSAPSQASYDGLRTDPGRARAQRGVGAWNGCGNGQSPEPLLETCSTLLSPLNSPLNPLLPFSTSPWWPHGTTPRDLLPGDDISSLSGNLGVVLNLPSRYHVLSVSTSWLSLIHPLFSLSTTFALAEPLSRHPDLTSATF